MRRGKTEKRTREMKNKRSTRKLSSVAQQTRRLPFGSLLFIINNPSEMFTQLRRTQFLRKIRKKNSQLEWEEKQQEFYKFAQFNKASNVQCAKAN